MYGIAPARATALDVLRAVRGGAFADHALEAAAQSLEETDRRLAQELAYGVLRLQGRLDHIINTLVKGGIGRLAVGVLDAVRLGAYQLLELDRIPAYAAVSEAVEAAKAAGGTGAASVTNAVLRRLGELSYESFDFPALEEDPLGHLSTWGSHPRWLVERWLDRWPAESVRRLVDYNNRRPAVYLTVAGDRERSMERLRSAGIEASVAERVQSSLRLESGTVSGALETIEGVVQDPGAAAVVDYLRLDPSIAVFDLCAAPGGKAAALAGRGHEVWAMDVNRSRLVRLLENRERLGLSKLRVVQADAARPPFREAEVVLLDVPCSGTGTLARHPDGRWRLRRGDIAAMADEQRRLLDGAADVVTSGGVLVYATCSLEWEENEGQVAAFLERRPDYERAAPVDPPMAPCLVDDLGDLRVLPQRDGLDGAYAARLRRRSN
ncbi:MAG: 16S rRNA (cytosine(967)-C(5))-methyltransferase RsmB [Gemmatimonadales bacterium]